MFNIVKRILNKALQFPDYFTKKVLTTNNFLKFKIGQYIIKETYSEDYTNIDIYRKISFQNCFLITSESLVNGRQADI